MGCRQSFEEKCVMGGRIAKAFMRFIAPVLIVAVMGSSSLVAGAGEINNIEIDTIDAGITDGDEISDTANSEEDDSDSLGMDVCFFIRMDEERTTIPDEPMNHFTFLYSNAIRINGAVSDDGFVYADSITEDITDDGFTARNAVTDKLDAYPTVSQIQEVYPTFDPNTQYVLWYVIKTATTAYPNHDVFIHVDGMILNKPEDDKKLEDEGVVSSELSFEVFSTNTQPQFEYDGEEHLIGGYVIRVTDSADGSVSEYVYGPYGDYLGVTVRSVGFLENVMVDGTVFKHKGIDYNVNVDSAFLLVRNPGTYEIPLLFKGMVMSAADIIIKDEAGNVVDTAKLNISTPSASDNITKRKLTIEAGSTIQNDNGTTLTNNDVNITSGSLLPGHRLITSIVGSQTGPGESVNEITSYDIVDADGKSYKDMYDVTSNKGWLVVVEQKSGGTGSGTGQAASGSEQITSKSDSQIEEAGHDKKSVVIVRDQGILGATRDDEGQSGVIEGIQPTSEKLSEAETTDKPAVLGARMSPTTDITMPVEVRISCIILCLMAIMIINIKRSKKF